MPRFEVEIEMEEQQLQSLIARLSEKDVDIKILPGVLDILSGSVKTSNVLGAVLIDLKTGLMPDWQQNHCRQGCNRRARLGPAQHLCDHFADQPDRLCPFD